jgi:integrase
MEGTWVKKGRLWRAWYKGRLIQRSCRQLRKDGFAILSETKEGSYLAFNRYYRDRVKEIDAEEAGNFHQFTQPQQAVLAAGGYTPEAWQQVMQRARERGLQQAQLEWLDYLFKDLVEDVFAKCLPLPEGVQKHLPPERVKRMQEAAKLWCEDTPLEPEKSVGANVEEWLQAKAREVGMGNRSVARTANDRNAIRHFVGFVGESTPTASVDETTVDQFYTHVSGRVKLPGLEEGRWSRTYVHEVWSVAKQFLRWAARRHLLRLPLNLDERKKWKKAKKVTTWTPEEFQKAVAGSTGKLKLAILLMANCGMYAADVARIGPEWVDWFAGTLTWRREKTGDVATVPTVTYKLWPTTLELLKTHRNTGPTHPELLLVNRAGLPYVTSVLLPSGRQKHRDGFKSHWVHVRKKLGINQPLKGLRKLGLSLLEGSEYARFTSHFLGHSSKTMAEAHYIDKTKGFQRVFEEAVSWIGRHLGQV